MLKINQKKIFEKTIHRKNVFSKGTGLMLHKKITNEAHIFHFKKPRKTIITMFLVFFAIDIIFIDKNKKIIEIKENLKPFGNYNPKTKTQYVIELPLLTIKKYNIKIKEKTEL